MGEVRIKLWLVRLFMIGAVSLYAAPLPAQNFSSRFRDLPSGGAYQTLLHAQIFNFGGFGYGQTITPEEQAFHKLLKSPNRLSTFSRLLRHASPEGQIYALYGLYLEDRSVFTEHAAKLKSQGGPAPQFGQFVFVNKHQVRVGSGCVLMQQDQVKVIDAIADGEFNQAFITSKGHWLNTK